MTIRPLQESDVTALAEIYNHYVRFSTSTFETVTLSDDEMHTRLFAPLSKYPCLVAEVDGKVVGYCALHPWRPRFDQVAEVTMYLAPDSCGKKIGKAMLSEIIEAGRNIDGLNGIIACINADNKHSRALVENMGFVLSGHYHRVGRKFNQWLDDVDYQLSF